jgi:hypothetical protein
LAPPNPKTWVRSLPPILRRAPHNSLIGYSKGARGLSVLWRASGVFTGTTNSPGGLLRQSSDRYAIRAGRNLPDKEFRYLRTVIVTAAVHRGFSSKLRPCELTSPFNLPAPGRRQPLYVVFDFAETCVFVKQSPDALHCDLLRGTPYPEVTESICLVPEQTITRAPENTLLVHLCRFVVRILQLSLADFPGRRPGGFPLPNLASSRIETIAHRDVGAASPHRS